jgi:hypothetical protein
MSITGVLLPFVTYLLTFRPTSAANEQRAEGYLLRKIEVSNVFWLEV